MSTESPLREDEQGVEREVVDEWTHPQMGSKAKEVILRRGNETRKKIEIYRKEKQKYGTLEGDGTEEIERWRKIDSLSPQGATETLFALAELHGYDLEPK